MQNSDIKYFYPAVRSSDSSTNGGRDSANQITSGVSSNVWDVIRSAQRLAETIEWEKVWCFNHNADNEVGYSPKVYLDGDPSAGDDWCYFIPATADSVEDDITGTEEQFVSGSLKTAIDTTAQTAVVTMKDADQTLPWSDGDTVRFQSARAGSSPTIVDVVLTAAPSISGLEVTLSFAAIGTAFAAGSSVSRVYLHDSACTPSVESVSYTNASDIDHTAMSFDNQGTVRQQFTLTILSGATTYTLVGDDLGSLGTGDTTATFEPENTDYSLPYISIPADVFTGLTLAEGDIFVFDVYPAGIPVWWRKENPTGAEVTNSNSLSIVMELEG